MSSSYLAWLRSGCASAVAAALVLSAAEARAQQPVAEDEEEAIPPGYTEAGPPAAPQRPADPYNYGVPPGTPMAYDIDDWEEGDPIPPGYRPDTRVRKGLVIGGAVTLGASWLIFGVLPAAIMVSYEEAEDEVDGEENGETPEDYYPLFIPVAGPFITIFTTESQAAGTAVLIVDGVVQTAGLAMLIAGLAAQETYLRPAPTYGEIDVHVAPVVGKDYNGAAVYGSF